MITYKEYKQRTEKYWKGKKVRTLRELRSGYWAIPKGMILEIHRKYKGFYLKTINRCKTCGLGKVISMIEVPPVDLELVGEE